MMKALLISLILLATPTTGLCSQRPVDKRVNAGEVMALQCPPHTKDGVTGEPTWTHHGPSRETEVTKLTEAEQSRLGFLPCRESLVIYNASASHRGNYSCSVRDAGGRFWFRLTVDAAGARRVSRTCHTRTSCSLSCPDSMPVMAESTTWHKAGATSPMTGFLAAVQESDRGNYTCTRHYRFCGRLYRTTCVLLLIVQPDDPASPHRPRGIISPRNGQTFYVELGSRAVIDCKAVTYSKEDDVFWVSGGAFVDKNESLPVFYYDQDRTEYKPGDIHIASLVFRNVSEADLLQNYTCKLETEGCQQWSAQIRLDKKPSPPPPPSYLPLALGVVCAAVSMVFAAAAYARFKVHVVLFLRDTLGCHRSSSDGRIYDVFLMCYESDADARLNALDRSFLKSVLEDRFGYSLCLYDRDVLPGKAAANAVLDCVEQSRTVVLVPTSSGSCPESGLLSAIHAALVERRTRLVFIQTGAERGPCSGSVPEALQLLAEAGDRVTWKGSSSMALSSSFWKRLRYYLPALQSGKKMRLLAQTNQNVI